MGKYDWYTGPWLLNVTPRFMETQEKKRMAKGQQGTSGTPPGQYPMNTGNPPPKGVTSKAGVPAKDQGRDRSGKSVAGADAKLPRHNARIRKAKSSKSSPS